MVQFHAVEFSFKQIKQRFAHEPKQRSRRADVVLLVLNWACLLVAGPVLCAVIAETLSLSGIDSLEDGFFLANYLIYLLAHLVLYLLTRSVRFSCLLTIVVVAGFSIANHYVIAFTGIPITFGDLMSIGVATAVAGGYTYTLDAQVIGCVIALLIYVVAVIAIPRSGIRVGFKQNQLAYALVLVAAVGVGAYLYGNDEMWGRIDTHEWNPAYPYTHFGFAMCLASDIANASEVQAEGYDASTLWEENVQDGTVSVNVGKGYTYSEDAAPTYTQATTKSPNIIVVMNESFSDLTNYLDGYETSDDPMPYVRSLMESNKVVSGTCAVSSDMGTGTANSEFEFLTGNSMGFFKGNTPYVQFIDSDTPSLASELGGRGYQTLAMHAYEKAGYNRVRVYDRFGFSEYKGIEDFDVDVDYTRDYPTDETNYRQLIEEYEQKQGAGPQFIFNVTVQNHGGYYATDYEWPLRITQTEPERSYDDSVTTYESSVRMADDAIKGLVSYFEKVDEPTVILFFGDHEPRLSNEFYASWFDDENNLDLDMTAQLHQTPFFIWNNYDLDTSSIASGQTVSLNYLSTLMMEAAGMQLSPYQQFLSDLREEHPVITARYFTDADGTKVGMSQDDIDDAIKQYQWLQYNCVFDRTNRIPGFYS